MKNFWTRDLEVEDMLDVYRSQQDNKKSVEINGGRSRPLAPCRPPSSPVRGRLGAPLPWCHIIDRIFIYKVWAPSGPSVLNKTKTGFPHNLSRHPLQLGLC